MLKPSLARGLQISGATTLNEYRQTIEKDAALTRRFQVRLSLSLGFALSRFLELGFLANVTFAPCSLLWWKNLRSSRPSRCSAVSSPNLKFTTEVSCCPSVNAVAA